MSLATYTTWIKAHEKLLMILVAAFLVFHIWGGALSAWIESDKRASTVQAQKVQADADNNKLIATEITAFRQQIAEQDVKIDSIRQTRAAQTVVQKKQDDVLAPNDLAIRISKLLNVAPIEVKSYPVDGQLILSNNAAHVTADDLEDLQQSKADVVDLNTELLSEKDFNAKQQTQVVGLQAQIVDEQTSHKKDVELERAKAKRSWLRGFKIGIVVGFVGAAATSLAKP